MLPASANVMRVTKESYSAHEPDLYTYNSTYKDTPTLCLYTLPHGIYHSPAELVQLVLP